MVTISQLEYIVSVDRLRHFGKAAEACHISQPSLSMQIQKVEEQFGIVLFDRNKKPILPTQNGKKFIEQAKMVLREHQKLVHLAEENFDELSGEFRLGIIPTLAPYLLPLFIHEFSRQFPKASLVIDELKTEEILLQLKEDKLDAAILATPLKEQGLRERPLFYEPFYLYLSPGHPLAKKQKVQEEDLHPDEMWLLRDGHCFRNQIINFCSLKMDGGILKNIRYQGGSFETLRYILKKNKGYTLFPDLFVQTLSKAEQSKSVREFKGSIPSREVSLVFRRNQWKKDLLEALELTIKEGLPSTVRKKESSKMNVIPIKPR